MSARPPGEAVQRFVERLTEAENIAPVKEPTPKQRPKRRSEAARLLGDDGIK